MLKKSISLTLSVLMLISVFTIVPLSAHAITYSSGDYLYEIQDDGTVFILEYKGSDETVYVPAEIDGRKVTGLSFPKTVEDSSEDSGNSSASTYNDTTKKVILPDGLKTIGNSGFESCYALTEITLPDSVTEICPFAFWGCKNLKSVTLPKNLAVISSSMFRDCCNLKNLTIPDSVTTIEDDAFAASGLEQINIPQQLDKIQYGVFRYCDNLKSIEIPSNISSIGEEAFANCSSLESVSIPNSVKEIDFYAFWSCPKLKSVEIPGSVTTINENALGFYYDENKDKTVTVDGFTIIGSFGSAAYTYAMNNNLNFTNSDSGEITTTPVPTTEPDTGIDDTEQPPYVKKVNPVKISSSDFTFDKDNAPGDDGVFYPFTVTNAQGEITYSLVSGTDENDVPYFTDSEYIILNEYNGELVLKNNTPNGTYKIKVRIYAAGNDFYYSKALVKTVRFTVTGSNPLTPTEKPSSQSSAPQIKVKKANTLSLSAKTVKVKSKKLKKKKQTVKPLTIKNAKGEVTVTKVKKGSAAKLFKKITVNKKTGAITIKKGKYAKKTYKIKLKITANGNSDYNSKTLTKVVKIKVK
jgi:hypothetical protein